jgi:hypothetical protein
MSSKTRRKCKRYRQPKTIDNVEHWQCARCKEWRPRRAFPVCLAVWCGISSYCRACQRNNYANWYRKNRTALLQRRNAKKEKP